MIREMLQSQNVIIEYLLSSHFDAIIPFPLISIYDKLYIVQNCTFIFNEEGPYNVNAKTGPFSCLMSIIEYNIVLLWYRVQILRGLWDRNS